MPTPNLVPARGAHFAEVSPQLIAFFDALRNPAITDQALLALLPGDSADFYKHDPRTGLIALHYAVYEGRAQILREMLVRLRINIPDNRQYQEAISTFSQSRNGETPEEYYQAREEYFNADAFALCLLLSHF
ncbi:MAG: hypothetical protein K0S29_1404 [Gammaproteobacteria bacterium]|nr:hypothetical protein [Gammaproteobacteria bacterium]